MMILRQLILTGSIILFGLWIPNKINIRHEKAYGKRLSSPLLTIIQGIFITLLLHEIKIDPNSALTTQILVICCVMQIMIFLHLYKKACRYHFVPKDIALLLIAQLLSPAAYIIYAIVFIGAMIAVLFKRRKN